MHPFRFQKVCERGYRAALKFAAFVSGKSEAAVESNYVKWCERGGHVTCEDACEDEVMDFLAPGILAEDHPEGANECLEILEALQRESVWVNPEGEDPELPEGDVELAFQKLPDKEVLEGMMDGTVDHDERALQAEYLPGTLLETMESLGCTWNALFRLAVRLRTAKGGVDCRWVPQARRCRRGARQLNWHQPPRFRLRYVFHCFSSFCCCQSFVFFH